ncbi:MAG: hypothetical protein KKA73_07775 [Chloroflexi bacterium]|nr:hypothetical protein [Chloroflexota bacterium]MBU1747571.1 hypothetical protein [Chloroflexota bacterium]MBU1878315.1 hypothetical protein [Chloroflexota bacterium]
MPQFLVCETTLTTIRWYTAIEAEDEAAALAEYGEGCYESDYHEVGDNHSVVEVKIVSQNTGGTP